MLQSQKIIIITAPSGAGKTSITRFLLQKYPQLAFSISAATRSPRGREENGKDYYFMSVDEFRQHIQQNDFVEWEMVYEGKYYGTLMTAKSLVFSTIFYTATKQVVRRRRPRFTEDPFDGNSPFEGGREYTSFPSGHSNTVFTVATALALEFRDTKWVPPLVYTIATLTAVSRLYENKHWSSDVYVGAAIGHFVTKALYKVEEKKARPKLYKLD